MFPYWLLFCLVAAGALGSGGRDDSRGQSGPLFAALGLFIILMIGLRYQVGGDWSAYARMFSQFEHVELTNVAFAAGAEPAYALVNWIAKRLGLGIWAVNLTCAAIFVWGLLRLALRQPRPWLAVLVAVPFLIIVVGMGYTRQSAALGLFMLALASLGEKRPLKAVLLIIFGTAFHTSALVTLPFIALSYARNRLEMTALIVVAVALAYSTLLAPRLEQYSYGYIEHEYRARGAVVRLFMNVVPALIFIGGYRRFHLDAIEKKLWRNLSLIAIVSLPLVLPFADQSVVLDRLGLYVIPLQMFVLARVPGAFGSSATSRVALSVFVVFYTAAVQFTWLNYAVHAEYWIPYRTVLSAVGS